MSKRKHFYFPNTVLLDWFHGDWDKSDQRIDVGTTFKTTYELHAKHGATWNLIYKNIPFSTNRKVDFLLKIHYSSSTAANVAFASVFVARATSA